MNPEITFDADGYPTDESLEALSEWDGWRGMEMPAARRILLEAVVAAWTYKDRAKEVRPGLFSFSTGGWSGNESLIGALNQHILILSCWDDLHLAGGLHVWAIEPNAVAEMAALRSKIVNWAWDAKPQEKKEDAL